jgi:Cys-rich four helix bundle protein (predicted Tat secretion target)
MNTTMNVSEAAISRRQVLLGAGALAATAIAGSAAAAEHQHEQQQQGHDHQKMMRGACCPHDALIKAAHDCVRTGQVCLDHCIEMFKSGDTTLAECADKVTELVAMSTALASMAASNSPHLKALAGVCRGVCKDCEDECRKHEKDHEVCKTCADACADCIKACDQVA